MFFGARDIFGLGWVAQRGAWGLHVGSETLQKWLVARGSNWTDAAAPTAGSEETLTSLVTPIRHYLSDEWRKGQKNQGHPLSKASLQNGDRFS